MNKLLEGSKVINIINNNDNIQYDIKDNSEIVINLFFDTLKNHNIDIKMNNNSKLVINYSGLSKDNNDIKINVSVNGDNNKLIVNGRFISLENICNVYVDAFALKNTKDNIIEENLKGINEDGMVMLNPVLRIDTNEINASHGASIGKFDKNVLFYLESKGLSEFEAKEIIKKCFLYSLFSDNFIKMLQEGNGESE